MRVPLGPARQSSTAALPHCRAAALPRCRPGTRWPLSAGGKASVSTLEGGVPHFWPVLQNVHLSVGLLGLPGVLGLRGLRARRSVLAITVKDAMSLLQRPLRSALAQAIKLSALPVVRTASTASHILPRCHAATHRLAVPVSRAFSPSASPMSPAVKMPGPAQPFLDAMAARRTVYALDKSAPIPQSRIEDIIRHAVLHVPSAFNSQTTRIVLLVGEEHDKLWEIVKESVKAVAPPEVWPTSE